MDFISLGASYFVSCLAGATNDFLKTQAKDVIERRRQLQSAENHNISRGIYRALIEATLYRSEAQLSRFGLGTGGSLRKLTSPRREHDQNLKTARNRGLDVAGHQAVSNWARTELNKIDDREREFFETGSFDIDPMIGFEDERNARDHIADIASKMHGHVARSLAATAAEIVKEDTLASIFEVQKENEEVSRRDDASEGEAKGKRSGADVLWDEYFRDSLREVYNVDDKFQAKATGVALASIQSGQAQLATGQAEITELLELLKDKTQTWGSSIPEETRALIGKIRSQIDDLASTVREESAKGKETTREEAERTRADIQDVGASVQRVERLLVNQIPQGFTVNSEALFRIRWNPRYSGPVQSQLKIFGRDEIDQWEEDLRNERIQLLAIHGEGGLGKSTIIETLWGRLRSAKSTTTENATTESATTSPFDVAIAVSMEYDQPCSAAEIAENVIPTLTQKKKGAASVADLDRLVREKRVLFIIDSLEEAMTPNCDFKEDYADLQDLLLTLVSAESKATTIIGARSLPQIIENRFQDRIRNEQLDGLSPNAALGAIEQHLGTDAEGLITETNRSEWEQVVSRLGGNPFVCFAVARMIKNHFDGSPGVWLDRAERLPSEAQEIYEWHWERLGERENGLKEREILLWLALSQGPVSTEELRNNIWSAKSRRQFENSLHRLQRQLPLEERNGIISAHSYITEFSAHRVIDISTNELTARLTGEHARGQVVSNASDHLQLTIDAFKKDIGKSFQESRGPTGRVLIDHCLVKASAPAPIRDFQRRSFVRPILRELQDKGLEGSDLRDHLRRLLKLCSDERWGGYLAGNLLTLLRSAGNEQIAEVDAPELRICQSDLRGVEVQNSNLKKARLQDVYFTQRIGQVRTLALSPEGTSSPEGTGHKQRYLAAGDDAGTVTVWRVGEETPIFKHEEHDGATIRAIAFSPDGNTLASADKNGQAWIWDSWMSEEPTLERLHTQEGDSRQIHENSQLRGLAFTANGQLLVSSESPIVWLHDLEEGTSKSVFDLNSTSEAGSKPALQRVHVLQVREGYLYAGTKNGRVYEIDLRDVSQDGLPPYREISLSDQEGEHSELKPCHQDSVFAIAVSQDGSVLATGGTDGHVHAWGLPDLELLDSYDHGAEVFSLAFLNESNRLASGGEDGSIAIWNLSRSRLERRLVGGKYTEGHWERVRALVSGTVPGFGPVFCSGGFDRKLIQWDQHADPLCVVEGYANGLSGLDSTPSAIIGSYESGDVLRWNISEPSRDTSLPDQQKETLHKHQGPAYCVAVDPNNEWVVSGGRSGTMTIKKLNSRGQPITVEEAHNHWIWSVDISPDGRQIATGSEDKRLHLWDLPLPSPPGDATPTVCTPDPKIGGVGLSHGDRVRVVRYHPKPERRLLASGGYDRAVRFWNSRNGNQRGLLENVEQDGDWIYALDFSERWFAAAWGNSKIRVWEVDTLLSYEGPWSEVTFAELNNDVSEPGPLSGLVQDDRASSSTIFEIRFISDSRLVVAGADKRARVWQERGDSWNNPENVFTFEHQYAVTSLAVLKDGRICSGDAGGNGYIWNPDESSEEAVAFSPLLPYQGLDLTGAHRRDVENSTLSKLSEAERRTLRRLGATV